MANGDLTFSGVHIDHPGARERQAGAESRAYLHLFTGTGRGRQVELTRAQLVKLIADAAKVLSILEGPGR